MSKKTKAFLFNLIGFAIIFIGFRFILDNYTNLRGYWVPITAFVISTILAPKFQAISGPKGEKIYVRWLFLKGIKEVG
jgi:hypothetical protein